MKKKFVNVALLAALACGVPAMLTSCNDDDWKNPVNTLETSTADLKATLTEIDNQIDQIDKAIADNKAAAAAADKAAADAMAAAKAANDEAVKASEAAKAASALAESAAAKAKEEALSELKTQIEAVKSLIQANADAIALNKAAIDGNAEAIKANTGKIEGNTQVIENILKDLANYAKTEDVNNKFGDLDKKYDDLKAAMEAAGVDMTGKIDKINGTVENLIMAVMSLQQRATALEIKTDKLDQAIKDQIGTLEETLAVKIAAGDDALQGQINDIKGQLEALKIPANIQEFTSFQSSTNTQLATLTTFQTTVTEQLSDLAETVPSLKKAMEENAASIKTLTTDLKTTKALADQNAAALTAQALSIAANQKDIASLKKQIFMLTEANGNFSKDIELVNKSIDDIVKRLNTIEPLLNTLTLGSLRGLVFIPEVYVGGIESALSYSMYFKPMTMVADTKDTKKYTLNGGTLYTVSAAKTWNNAVAANATEQTINPATVVSYHMNPTSANVAYEDLKIVSNDAEILSRASNAKIELDGTFNDNKGFAIADGIVSVAITGKAPIFSAENRKMPVFALQAKVKGAKDEEGKEIVNTVTSDYAMFAQMNIKPIRIRYNEKAYAEKYGINLRDFIDVQTSQNITKALANSTNTTVAWDGSVDLLNLIEVTYKDIQRNEESVWTSPEDWGKFDLDLSFRLVDYTIGDNKVSESSWATIDPETGVLTSKKTTDALGHMPLVYITLKHGNELVLDGFVRVKIVPNVEYYTTTAAIYAPVDFTCEGDIINLDYGKYDILNMMMKATGMSQEVILANYQPAIYVNAQNDNDPLNGTFLQFQKLGDAKKGVITEEQTVDYGMLAPMNINATSVEGKIEYNITWKYETIDLQNIYEGANHSATTYVCYEGLTDSYPDIYIPVQFSVNEKAVYRLGDKLLARWFRKDNSTALMNVPVPTNGQTVTNINTNLNQLWQNGKPKFAWVSGTPKPEEGFLPKENSYKYYFTAANNREITVDGVKYKFTVTSATNPTLNSTKRFSNADMANHALLVNEAVSEYNNTVLYVNGEKLATLDNETGDITLESNATALKVLNLFPSMSEEDKPAEDRTLAQLYAMIGIVPYSSCDIAYKLTNPDFNATFLRPINVYKSDRTYDIKDAQANGYDINIFGMMDLSDWRGVKFYDAQAGINNTWLYAYYNVKSIVPDFTRMLTNAGNLKDFVHDPIIAAAFTDNSKSVTYTAAEINSSKAANAALLNRLDKEQAFGVITYKNQDLNVKEFQVKIPFKVTYELGEFEVWATCTILATER